MMTEMPRVTVAILAYNRPEFLGEAIESVLAQTYTDFKLVIYDNCSERDLKSVVDRYDDTRVIYHRNEKNLGLFGNAAQAVDLCDTELLDIFHDDDRMFPWALERLVEVMDKYPEVGFASAKRIHILGSGDLSRHKERREGTLYTGMMRAEIASTSRQCLICPGTCVRPAILRAKGVNYRADAGPAGDVLFDIECSARGVAAFGLDAPLVEYRYHPGQCTNTAGAEAWHRSHKVCYEYAVSHSLGAPVADALKTWAAHMSLASYTRALLDTGELDMDKLAAWREFIDKDLDMKMSNEAFGDGITVGSIGSTITAVGMRQAPISEYRARVAELRRLGIPVPFKRRLKWFVKYIVGQRWLGRR